MRVLRAWAPNGYDVVEWPNDKGFVIDNDLLGEADGTASRRQMRSNIRVSVKLPPLRKKVEQRGAP